MEEKKIICITCPLGCEITVRGDADRVDSIEGHACKRGEAYARDEFIAPVRILTTSVSVAGAGSPLVPVRSRTPIPKGKMFDCVRLLQSVELTAPVGIYDVVVSDILGTGVDIVATAAAEAM